MNWLYSRLELAEKGDVSDAGMAYFVITGHEQVTRAELREFLTGPRAQPPSPGGAPAEQPSPADRRSGPAQDARQPAPAVPDRPSAHSQVPTPAVPQGRAPLEVSQNGRFLQFPGGEPFFWLADTGWEMFHRASREDAQLYLDTRA